MRVLEHGRLAITDRRVYRTPKVYWSTPGAMQTMAWHDFEVGIGFSFNPDVGFIRGSLRRSGSERARRRPPATDTLNAGYASYIEHGYYSGADMGFAGIVYHDGMRVGATCEQVAR